MPRTLISHGMSIYSLTLAFATQQTFDIKATTEPSAKTIALLQLGIIVLMLIGLVGFLYSWRQGKKQAEKHMRAAGLQPDRDEATPSRKPIDNRSQEN